ncbi:alpha/beta fold hydrolase [Nocardia sp. NPDC051321]|uniref:alpha/beta fold hydrolase n=1 Tax=Nocardia sp. NPDC051321 TaxID=3364323 RepID=UPI00379C1479
MKRTRALTAVLASVTGLVACAGLVGCAGQDVTAKAEPPALERFYQQQLDWKACDNPKLDPVGGQCAVVTVPLNYADPQGATTTVAISRLASPEPAKRRGAMLSNPGGPGGSGLDFMIDVGAAMTPDVRAQYDLIGMDPRGVGRSAAVNCHWPRGFGLESAGVDAASFAESVATQADFAARCATTEAARLPFISTRNTARDMDVIRGALGVDKVSYFGTSYGTYLGAVFTQMFPERSDRIVLDSAADPDAYGPVGMMQAMGPANEAALDLWADWAAARDNEYHFGSSRAAVRATVTDLIQRSAKQPIRLGGFEIDDHTVPTLLFVGLDDQRAYEMVAGQLRQLVDAADGKAVQPDDQLRGNLEHIFDTKDGDGSPQMAVMCGDVAAPRDPAFYLRNIEAARASQPVFGAFANNITSCAFWAPPAEAPTAVHNSVPSLILNATGDTRTAYQGAVALHQKMTGSAFVTLQDVSIHYIFGRFPNTCVYSAVNAYLRDGTLPTSDTTCRAD